MNETAPIRLNWDRPPDACVLRQKEVDVWAADLKTDRFDELQQHLSTEEQVKAGKFYFERDKRFYIAGRGFAREILANYLGIHPKQIQFSYGKNGKPSLATEAGLHFNLSHSGRLLLMAVTRNGAVGIDVEQLRNYLGMSDIAAISFSPEQQAALQSTAVAKKEEFFFRMWTRNEAELKRSGKGFGEPFAEGRAQSNFVAELDPAEGYIAALAADEIPSRINLWQWSGPDARRRESEIRERNQGAEALQDAALAIAQET